MTNEAIAWGKSDLDLMQNAAVTLFWQREMLDETIHNLTDLSYDVRIVDCNDGWASFQAQLSTLLQWDEQFGYSPWSGNLDALNDGLWGYPFPENNKAALALVGFHRLVRDDRRSSNIVLDLLEKHSRHSLLFSKVLIVLVQTDDNRFSPPVGGGRTPQWNREEWMNENRGL